MQALPAKEISQEIAVRAHVPFKKKLITLLDRPGGRFLLGRIATHFAQGIAASKLEVLYANGLWTHRVGSVFFPDSRQFDYKSRDFRKWEWRAEHCISDAEDFWLHGYAPQEGHVIVDIGAGRGEDMLTFSRAVGRTGRVIGVEAHPLSFAILKSFCQLNGLSNVAAVQLALMDKSGVARMSEEESAWIENTVVY